MFVLAMIAVVVIVGASIWPRRKRRARPRDRVGMVIVVVGGHRRRIIVHPDGSTSNVTTSDRFPVDTDPNTLN